MSTGIEGATKIEGARIVHESDDPEFWQQRIFDICREVEHTLLASDAGRVLSPIDAEGLVCEALFSIFTSRTESFVEVTFHPAVGTTYRSSSTFLYEKFRSALTAAAHKLLCDLSHPPASPSVSSVVATHHESPVAAQLHAR